MGLNRVLITLALILVVAFSVVPTVASLSFAASVTCTGPTFGIIGVSFAYWNWTSNGVPIGPFVTSGIISASGVLHCNSTGGGPNTTTGTGTQPSNANGIIVRVTSQIKACYHVVSASQSFASGQPVSITLKASCVGNAYGTPVRESGTFTLTS